MIIVHAYTMIIVHAHPVSTNHMISIVVNDQFKTVKIFDTLCLPLLPDMTHAKKVDQMRDTFEKVKKKYHFGVGGTHIDVTTLERNDHLF